MTYGYGYVRNVIRVAFGVGVFCVVSIPSVWAQIGGGTAGGVFEIDGNLPANTPASLRDWLDGPTVCAGGTGGILSNAAPGNPKAPVIAPFFSVDHNRDGTSNNDEVFKGQSNKLSDDPNTYSWKAGSAPQKDDIGNAGFAFFLDASSDLWAVVFGDRRAINGDSYIDYEFLQSDLTQDNDGGFTSGGPNGGRTVGDLIITIKLAQGGGVPAFSAQTWTNVPVSASFPAGYGYVDIAIPAGKAFVSANTNFVAGVCFGAFGSTNYAANAFGEAAVNVSKLLPALVNNACFHISTVFMRTKSSTSPTAELKDFITPVSVGICVDTTPPSVVSCPEDADVQCPSGASFGTPTFLDNCGSEVSVTSTDVTLSAVCPAVSKVRRTWTATDECGNASTCSQTLTLLDTQPPTVSNVASNTTVVCPAPATFTTPTFVDMCDPVLSITVTQEFLSVTCPEVQKVRRTWTARDDCGNAVSTNQVITTITSCTPSSPLPPLP